jgi:hypothetical protein
MPASPFIVIAGLLLGEDAGHGQEEVQIAEDPNHALPLKDRYDGDLVLVRSLRTWPVLA